MANNLTLTGAQWDTSAPALGSAALKGGYGIPAQYPYSNSGAITIALRFRIAQAQVTSTSVIVGGSSWGAILSTPSGLALSLLQSDGTSQQIVQSDLSKWADGAWHGLNIIFDFDNGFSLLLLDGVRVQDKLDCCPLVDANNFAIGNMAGAANYQFPGAIDEVAIIQNRYTVVRSGEFYGNEPLLLALWHLNGDGSDSTGTPLPWPARPYDLTLYAFNQQQPAFDTADKAFGSASLSGGYGVAQPGLIGGFPFAVEIRFRMPHGGQKEDLEMMCGQDGVFWLGTASNGQIRCNAGGVDIWGPSGCDDGNWHTAAFSADQTGGLCFLDGVQFGNFTADQLAGCDFLAGGLPNQTGGKGYFAVGNFGGYPTFGFDGEVDEPVLFSTHHFQGNYTPTSSQYTGFEDELLEVWHLDGDGSSGYQKGVSTGDQTHFPSDFNLTLDSSASFDTANPIMGSGSLNGGFGWAGASPLGNGPVYTLEWLFRITADQLANGKSDGMVMIGGQTWGRIYALRNQLVVRYFTTPDNEQYLTLSNTSWADGAVHGINVVFDYDANQTSLYLDGGLAGTQSGVPMRGSTDFAIGNYAGQSYFPWPGELDEVAAWARAKTDRITAPYVGNEPDLIAVWHLDSNGLNGQRATVRPYDLMLSDDAAFDTDDKVFGTASLSAGHGYCPAGMITGFPFSVECRFKATSVNNPTGLGITIGQNELAWAGIWNNGGYGFAIGSNDDNGVPYQDFDNGSKGNWLDGQWHTMAFSISDTEGAYFFIDGELLSQATAEQVANAGCHFSIAGSPTDSGTGTGVLGVRTIAGNTGYDFPGLVDEVLVTQTMKFTASYTPTTTPYNGSDADVLALYHLDGDGTDSYNEHKPVTMDVGTGAVLATLQVSQDFYLTDAQYTIQVDGQQVGGTLEAGAIHNAGTNDVITVRGSYASGNHTVTVTFLNDEYGGSPDTDRNLYLVQVQDETGAVVGGESKLGSTGDNASAVVNIPVVVSGQIGTPTFSGTVVGGTTTVSGTYSGGRPAGLSYSLDGGAAQPVSSPTIDAGASGSYSFTIPTPAQGNHSLTVTETGGTPNATSSPGSFTVTAAGQISAPSLSGSYAGGLTVATGTYSNQTPSTFSIRVDGGAPVSVPNPMLSAGSTAGSGTYTFSFTTPAAGTHSVVVVTDTATSSASSLTTVTLYRPNSPVLVLSPFNWLITGAAAEALYEGACLDLQFTGAVMPTFLFDVSAAATPVPLLFFNVDGQGWKSMPVAASVQPAMPAATAGWGRHTVRMVLGALAASVVGFTGARANRARFTGCTLPSASSAILAVVRRAAAGLLLGDGTSSGFQALGTADPGGTDATLGFGYRLGDELGVDMGVCGVPGQGLTVAGSRGFPALSSAWNKVLDGGARDFTTVPPAFVLLDTGAADAAQGVAAGTFQTAYLALINNLLGVIPSSAPVLCMRPFAGGMASAVQGAVNAAGKPARVKYLDTSGLVAGTDLVGGYPTGAAAMLAARAVANLIRPAIGTGGSRGKWTFGAG